MSASPDIGEITKEEVKRQIDSHALTSPYIIK